MRLLASELAHAVHGTLAGPDVAVDGASFDSRDIEPGQLFVPLVAERDGHEFIDAAIAAGAPAYFTSRNGAGAGERGRGATGIVVADTAAALMDAARFARDRLEVPVVAVTGSVGKTSTKDMAAAALAATRRVAANRASFNNEQGLPVTVLNAPDDVEAMVLEMGMRGFGEITRLCEVGKPTIGVVTRVAGAHTERVGDIDGVARAKRELIEALPASGVAILNGDDPRVRAMRTATDATVITYGDVSSGRTGEALPDVRLVEVALDELARPRIVVDTPWGAGAVQLLVSGRHMASNALAALAVAGAIEGDIGAALTALGTARLSVRRMQVHRTRNGATVIDDAYNANPESAEAALDALAAVDAQRRVAVFGPMAELDDPVAGHARVARRAADLGIEIIAVDTDLYGVQPVAGTTAAVAALGQLDGGDAVLVKASNSARLWRVVDALLTE